jgi:hypothetical protein
MTKKDIKKLQQWAESHGGKLEVKGAICRKS